MKGQLFMKKIRRLYQYKGFTLVECVIAIAVFAVLTSMIMLILAQTTALSKKASENEDNLNDLVQNVVSDKSPKVYGADSEVMHFTFGNSPTGDDPNNDFYITYTTIDGMKNYVKCPGKPATATEAAVPCGNVASLIDYLDYIYDSTEYKNDPDKAKYSITHWFGTAPNDRLICPKCGLIRQCSAVQFTCLSCSLETTLHFTAYDPANINTKYIYINKGNNTICCGQCGSGNVVESGMIGADGTIDASVTSDATFNVSGIRTNAIRYGNVKPYKEEEDILKLITLSATSEDPVENYTMSISAQPKKSMSSPVEYKVSINITDPIGPTSAGDDGTAMVTLKLPGTYICNVLPSLSVNTPGGTPVAGNPSVAIAASSNVKSSTEPSALQITGITDTKRSSIQFSFTLANYANAHNFEDDYIAEFTKAHSPAPSTDMNYTTSDCALTRYWFRSPTNTIQNDRTSANGKILLPS